MMQQVSIWEEQSFYAPQDFIIAGAGFTGLWVAFHLKQKFPDKNICILERGMIPAGASPRNAGFACFGSLSEILADMKTRGPEQSMRLVQWRFEGLKMIRQYFPQSLIDYQVSGGFELLNDPALLNELSNINSLLYPATKAIETFTVRDDLIKEFGFAGTRHLIENRFEGGLHSGKLLKTLAQMLYSSGVQILYGCDIKDYEETDEWVTIHTSHKKKWKARQLILCTNAYIKKMFPDLDITPARGQVLLTEPIPDLKIDGVFHFDEGYYYFRNLGDRILLGGARNASFETEFTFDQVTTNRIQHRLEEFLTQVILPGQKPKITHRWAGIMAMGGDKFPIVRKLSPRTRCAVRLSGMGVALAPTVGKMVAADISV